MAIVGVSKPYYAKYHNDNGNITYSDGGVMGQATEVNVNINSNSSNLYADNIIAETNRSFAGGDLGVKTADLTQAVSRDLLGAAEKALEEIDGIEDEGVKELVFTASDVAPEMGVGFIIKKYVGGRLMFRAVILLRVVFSVPSDAATTQGETIEWTVHELSGTVMRSHDAAGSWKKEATFTTEAQAEAYIKHRLNIGGAAA